MPEVVIRHSAVVLDACIIINLAATGEFEGILETLPTRLIVTAYVLKHEVISYINAEGQEISVNLALQVEKGLLQAVALDTSTEDEADYVVAFEAQRLDAGEAQSAAIAINRGWALATDDKRAIKIVPQTSPNTQIMTTPELMKLWADQGNMTRERIRQAIRSIRRYLPPDTHPLAVWWKQFLT